MSTWTWKDITAFAVFLITFAGLLFGFYNGIRADMREMRTEMRAMNGTLAEVRERLAVIETRIGIEAPGPAEKGQVEQNGATEGAIEQSSVEQGVTARIVRAFVPASWAWFVDVYFVRSAGNASARFAQLRK